MALTKRQRLSAGSLILSMIFLSLGACGGAMPGYGPAYVPECTCCCGGGFTPYAYKQSNHSSIAGPPVATTMLHDTKGPMADVSANGKSQKKPGKSPRH